MYLMVNHNKAFRTYYEPSTMLSVLCRLSCFILPTVLSLPFDKRKNKVLRDEVTRPKPHLWSCGEAGMEWNAGLIPKPSSAPKDTAQEHHIFSIWVSQACF